MLFAVEGTFHGVGEYVLPSGIGITIRPIRPEDAAGLRDGFAHLSPESRYRRFFRALATLSDDAVRYLEWASAGFNQGFAIEGDEVVVQGA